METVIRVTVIYAFIIVGLRIMGKREFGQLSPLELVTLLIIPEILTEALVRDDHSVTNASSVSPPSYRWSTSYRFGSTAASGYTR